MAKVYISSTFEDLEAHRERVYRTLRKLKCDVIAMEDYVALDKRPLDACLSDIASCDLYVGILAWRYGFVPRKDNPDKKSITELEFRHAVSSGKDCLLFLHDESSPWPRKFVDTGVNSRRLEDFRKHVGEEYTVAFFDDADQLAAEVATAVSRWLRERDIEASVDSQVSIPNAKILLDNLAAELKKEVRLAVMDVYQSGDAFTGEKHADDGTEPKAADSPEAQTDTSAASHRDDDNPTVDVLTETAAAWGMSSRSARRAPRVDPIVLAVGSYLEKAMVDSAGEGFSRNSTKFINALREQVLEQYGVHVPGIRVTGELGNALKHSYVISVNEIPLVSGKLEGDARFCPVSVSELNKLGIKSKYGVNPVNGSDGSWVPQTRWRSVSDHHLPLWETSEYALRHLQSVIVKNLPEFVGIQEAYSMLAEYSRDLAEDIAKEGGLAGFREVLLLLLEEYVPVTQIERIGEAFVEGRRAKQSALEIAEQIRCCDPYRTYLQGNNPDTTLYRPDKTILDAIEEGLVWASSSVWLQLLPENNKEIIEAISQAVTGDPSAACVTGDPIHRRAIRRIVELDDPSLPVLADAELIPELASKEPVVFGLGQRS